MIIVGPDSPLKSLTPEDIKNYYLGERTQLPGGEVALPTMRPAGSPEKELFLRKVLGCTERDFKQTWLARIYRGEASSPPLVLESDVSVRRYVTQVRGAIGYIDRNASTDGVRVLFMVREDQ